MSRTADPLTGKSYELEKTIAEGSDKFLFRTTDPCTVQSVPNSAVTIGKDGVAISVSLNRDTKMARVPDNTESTARLDNTESQFEPGSPGNIEGDTSSLPNSNDLEPAEYAIDQTVGHRGTGTETEYKVRRYGYRKRHL